MSGDRLGRYTLERKIAMGGMAEIWLAKQDGPAGFEKELVIKRILPHLSDDEKFVGMFLDEARLAAQLTHPNIAQIFDLGELDGSYFIAMEFIDGYDLADIVERASELGRAVPPAVAAKIVADACQALDYAHTFRDKDGTEIQLVHRDVSPQNILVARSGVVKLVDFGVAKAATSQHKTQTGAVKGKLSYMSPEQISGKTLDGRSDLFALGIVLYELVTAQRPFGHASELLAITAILNEQPPSPRMLVQGVPPELEAVIFGALEKDRDKRISTAREMQLALESVLRDSGALLSARDIADYLQDLFSDAPTHAAGQIAALAVTDVGQDLAAARLAAVTTPSHPSASTRADHPSDPTQPQTNAALSLQAGGAPLPVSGAPMSPPPGGPPGEPPVVSMQRTDGYAGEIGDTEEGRSGRKGVWIAVAVASVLLLALAAGLAWWLVGPGSAGGGGDGDEAVVVLADAGAPQPPNTQVAEPALGDDVLEGDPSTVESADAVANADDTEGAAADQPKPPELVNGVGAQPDADASGEETSEPPTTEPDVVAEVMDVQAAPTPDATEPVDEPVVERDVEPADTGTPERQETDPATTEPRAVRPPEDGRIQIRTSGGSHTVSIDGRRVGSLPGRTIFTVAPGRHTVVVESSDGSRHEERVNVGPGETERVRVP